MKNFILALALAVWGFKVLLAAERAGGLGFAGVTLRVQAAITLGILRTGRD